MKVALTARVTYAAVGQSKENPRAELVARQNNLNQSFLIKELSI